MAFRKPIFLAAALMLLGASSAGATELKEVGRIVLPAPTNGFGSVYLDPASGMLLLPDRTNKTLDLIDTHTNTVVGQVGGFTGDTGKRATSGPSGAVMVNGGSEAWVSDGDSTVKIVDLATRKIVGSVSTGGKARTSEMAYDPDDHVVIVANGEDNPSFLTLISTRVPHSVLGRVALPQASSGLERIIYVPDRKVFLAAIPQLDKNKHLSGFAEIDPQHAELMRFDEIRDCDPHGLSLGPNDTVFAACNAGSKGSGLPTAHMAVYDLKARKVSATITGFGGGAQSATDLKRGLYYVASNDEPKGPSLGVINAKTNKLVQRVPTWAGTHALALAPNGNVYLPTRAQSGPCNGCVLIYAQQ